MKKAWCILLTAACLLGSTSCAGNPEEPDSAGQSTLPDSPPAVSELVSEREESSSEEPDSQSETPSSSPPSSAPSSSIPEEIPADAEPLQTESSSPEQDPQTGCLIENFPLVRQMPELPTGCEITALTMVLNYYGFPAEKMTMALQYLPITYGGPYYGSDGVLYGPDLNAYFWGEPTDELGGVCGTGAIVTAADGYLQDQGSSMRAVDLTGSSPEELYQLLQEGCPSIVWVTIAMADRAETQGWYTDSGAYVDWSNNDHGAVLIGYSEDTITVADPISGIIEYDRSAFESVFASRGNRCVILS